MRIKIWLASGVMLGVLAGAAAARPVAADLTQRAEAFHALLTQQWGHQMEVDPESATVLGDLRYNDRWNDVSLAHIRAEHDVTAMFPKRFQAVDPTGFSDKDKLNRQLMMRQLQASLRGFDLKLYEMPIYQWRNSTPLLLASEVEDFPFNTKDYEDYLKRLKAIPTVLRQTIAVARHPGRDRPLHLAAVSKAGLEGRPTENSRTARPRAQGAGRAVRYSRLPRRHSGRRRPAAGCARDEGRRVDRGGGADAPLITAGATIFVRSAPE